LTKKNGIATANATRLREYTQIRWTKFFGVPVAMHQAVHEPLACVEKEIRARCDIEYRPKVLSGWRANNTYLGSEISNHVFGLAIDVDPTDNSCCGCLGNWAKSKLCEVFSQTMWKLEDGPGLYALPDCWIEAFEANGFYWLGHDKQLRDTMHFEYLAPKGSVSCK